MQRGRWNGWRVAGVLRYVVNIGKTDSGALASNPADKQRAMRLLFIFIVFTSKSELSGSRAIAR